jgi:hypothetical protein
MMQSGMFVAAQAYRGELCAGLFTHYKREEDATMTRGKLHVPIGRAQPLATSHGEDLYKAVFGDELRRASAPGSRLRIDASLSE